MDGFHGKRHFRQPVLFLLIILITALLLPGCFKTPQQGEPGGPAPAVISLWHTLQGAEADILQAQIEKLMKSHPELIIKPRFVPEQNLVSLAYQAEAGGEGPDLFLVRREILDQLYAQGILAPVVQFSSDAFPAAVAQFRFNGKLFAQPFLTDVPVFYFRKDVVTAPANLTQFTGKGGLVLSSLDAATLSPWWTGQGGRLWSGRAAAVDAPENLAFLQQLLSWRDTKQLQVMPNALSLFANGQVNYTVAWAGQASMLTQLNVPWGSLPMSDLVAGQGQTLLGPTLGLANSSIKTTEAMAPAIQLVEKALLAPEVEGAFVQGGYGVPASTAYYQRPEAGQGFLAQVNQTLSKAWPLEGSAPEQKLIPLQDAAWAAAFAGTLSPQDALANAQSQAAKVLGAAP